MAEAVINKNGKYEVMEKLGDGATSAV